MKRITALLLLLIVIAGGAGVFYWTTTAEVRNAAAQLPKLKKEAESMGLVMDEGSAQSLTTVDPSKDAAKDLRTVGAAIMTRLPQRRQLAEGFANLAESHPDLVESAAAISDKPQLTLGGLESAIQVHEDLRLVTSLLVADAELAAKARKFSLAEQRYEQANKTLILILGHPRLADVHFFLMRRLSVGNSIMGLAATHDRDADMLAFCDKQIDALPRVPDYTTLARLSIYDQIFAARGLNTTDTQYLDTQSDEVTRMFPSGEVQIPAGTSGSEAMEARVIEFWTSILTELKSSGDSATRAAAAQAATERLLKADGKSYAAIKLQRAAIVPLVRAVEAIKVWDATAKLGILTFETRRKTGQFPTALPESPLRQDPFSMGGFKYSVIGSGFKIYSVGPNQTDDGGPKLKGLRFAGEVADDLGYVHNPTQVDSPESPVAIAETKGRPPE